MGGGGSMWVEVEFKGLTHDQNRRLNEFVREVYAGMESKRHGVLVGYAGRFYRHSLPRDIAGNDMMLTHLTKAFSSDGGDVVAEIEYGERPEYLKITRRVGL